MDCGADLVIHSLHKTLPSLTQTALLHVNSDRIDKTALRRFLSIYQSSSPSYLLMASIEQCMRFLKEEGSTQMSEFTLKLNNFYKQAKSLKHLKVFDKSSCSAEECFDHDISKILISIGDSGISAKKLYQKLLHNYQLQMEMCSGHYVTALTSLMDTSDGFRRLLQALKEIDDSVSVSSQSTKTESKKIFGAKPNTKKRLLTSDIIYQNPKPQMPIALALEQPSETLSLKASTGHISQEYIFLYPPGIPLLAPGEILTGKLLGMIEHCQKLGLSVEGLSDMNNQSIQVVKQ